MIEIIQEYWRNYLYTDGYRITGVAISVIVGADGLPMTKSTAVYSSRYAQAYSTAARVLPIPPSP